VNRESGLMGVCLLQSDIVDLKLQYLQESSVKSMHDDDDRHSIVIDDSCVEDMPSEAYIELQPPQIYILDNHHTYTDNSEDPAWDIPIVSSSDELIVLPVHENHTCDYLDIGMEVTCSQSEEVSSTESEDVDITSEYEEPVHDATNSSNENYRCGLGVKRKVTRLAVNTIKRFRPSSSLSSIRPSSPVNPPPFKPKQDMMDLLDRKRKRVKDGLYQYVLWKQQYLKEQDSTFERRKSIKYASHISCGT